MWSGKLKTFAAANGSDFSLSVDDAGFAFASPPNAVLLSLSSATPLPSVHLKLIDSRYAAIRAFNTDVGCTVAPKIAPLLNVSIRSAFSSAVAEPVITIRRLNELRNGDSPSTVANDTVDPEKVGPRTRSEASATPLHAFHMRRNERLFRRAT